VFGVWRSSVHAWDNDGVDTAGDHKVSSSYVPYILCTTVPVYVPLDRVSVYVFDSGDSARFFVSSDSQK
jgi:hypothetical protein